MILLVVIALTIVGYLDDYGPGPAFAFVVSSILGGLAFFGIGSFVSHRALDNGTAVLVSETTTELRALNTDSAALRGATFLTLGSVDGNRVYTYIHTTDDGGFIVATRALGRAVVYEHDDLDQPYMREASYRGSWWWTWTSARARAEFHVPTGSVQEPAYDVSIDEPVTGT